MVFWKSCLAGGLFLLCFGSLRAQGEEMHIRVLGFEEGVSHRNIYKIHQDSLGFIWFSTFNGLNRYDGYEFLRFEIPDTIEGRLAGPALNMFPGPQNRLWLARPDYLSVFDPFTLDFRHLRINDGELARGEERTAGHVCIGPAGDAWMAVFSEKNAVCFLQHYDPAGERTIDIPLPGKYPNRPLLRQEDTLWLGAYENELWQLNAEGEIIDRFNFGYWGRSPGVARIVAMQRSHREDIYVLLQNGHVYFRQAGQKKFSSHPISERVPAGSMFSAFLVEPEGDIWLAGDETLLHFDAQRASLRDFNPEVREITRHQPNYRQIFQDGSGVVWVASDFGAVKIVRTTKLFTTYLSGGNSYCSSGFCSMRGIAEDDNGHIYFSYYNSIHRLDPRSGDLKPLFPGGNFLNGPFGLVWYKKALFTGNGTRIDLASGRVDTLLRGPASDQGVLLVDHKDQLWLGNKHTLFQYQPSRRAWKPFRDEAGALDSFPHTISYLHEGQRSKSLWIGTVEHGIFRLDPAKKQLSPFPADISLLRHPRVLACYEDPAGLLWVATAKGLHCFDLVNNALRVYGVEEGLPNDFINGILPEGDSCIWASTDNGLVRLRLRERKMDAFFVENGLPANEFNRISFYKSRDGRFYFGGLNGVVAFYPGPAFRQEKKKRDGKLLLTYISKLDGQTNDMVYVSQGIHLEKGIRLSYNDRFFTLGFSLADFANPREHKYSYMLEGLEKEWSPPSAVNYARYNNLPSGKYTFRVRATDGSSGWTSEGLAIPIIVEQAYYKSPWFFLICALGLLGAAYGFFRYRLYTLHKRELYLEEQVRLRTFELEEEKKKSEDLLLNILPEETARELKANGSAKARFFDAVTVMFIDFEGFTRVAEELAPEDLVAEIDFCFRAYDQVMENYGLEKIKTVGDAYLCVGGLPGAELRSAVQIVRAALDIQEFMKRMRKERSLQGLPFFRCRIGIHTGSIVAGIVGFKKFAYDIWGDTVNTASRMESNGEVDRVNISQTTYDLVNPFFQCFGRGKLEAKNKGEIEMYFVEKAMEGVVFE
jgi:class 3 adenylate cyclase/ligand-binding sensor domain-containing protein